MINQWDYSTFLANFVFHFCFILLLQQQVFLQQLQEHYYQQYMQQIQEAQHQQQHNHIAPSLTMENQTGKQRVYSQVESCKLIFFLFN